jgi:hypothetical protein
MHTLKFACTLVVFPALLGVSVSLVVSPAISWAQELDPLLLVAGEPSDRLAIPVLPPDRHEVPPPSFQLGFLTLKQQLGELMGQPLEDEHPAPDGGADMIQLTSTGLAAWTEGKMPAFTDGDRTWLLAPALSPPAGALDGATRIASPPSVAPSSVWDTLARCESQGNWSIHTGNGYYGGLQEDLSFWRRYGGTAYAARPDLASRSAQIAVAQRGLAAQGWGAWPSCSRVLGLR